MYRLGQVDFIADNFTLSRLFYKIFMADNATQLIQKYVNRSEAVKSYFTETSTR